MISFLTPKPLSVAALARTETKPPGFLAVLNEPVQ
jgi:hypothetical protein